MSGVGTGDAEVGPGDLPSTGNGVSLERQRQRTTFAITLGFLLLAAVCGIATVLSQRIARTTDEVLNGWEVRHCGNTALQALLDAETGQRGFLLTHDPAYLQPFIDAHADFTRSMTCIRERSAGRVAYLALANAFSAQGTKKFLELDRTVELARAGKFDDAARIVSTGTGKTLMDDVRRTERELAATIGDDLTDTMMRQRYLNDLALAAILTALALTAGLAVLLLTDARRQFGLLHARESDLRQTASGLERGIAARTAALAEVNQRFDVALRASGVTVMTQDRDLVFTWISRGALGRSASEVIGKPEQVITPEPSAGPVIALKRGVIETGQPARGDVRIVHGGVEVWYDLTVHPLTDSTGATTGIIAGATDITRYKEQEAHIRLLMRELTHRSKNLLTVIEAIMRQTLNNSISLEDFQSRFSARLHALAGSHDLLVRENWQGASVGELIRSQLGHYTDLVGSQIELSGEPMFIRPDAAQHIGMALHELATNAAKYGALSVPQGTVQIAWRVGDNDAGERACRLSWTESGGPPVARPARRGFGRVVIERTVARAVDGVVTIDYAPTGLRWTLNFPATYLSSR